MPAAPQGHLPQLDAVVVGGGIAGLWLLARLQAAGYSAVLIEAAALGGGQTLASQGIVHGGLKYALDLKLNAASDALADMPARWQACLEGRGEVDLRGVQPAAARHLFWTRRTLGSRIAGFFGSKLLRGRVDTLAPDAWPAVLRDPDHVAAVYALDEMVLDTPQLVQALVRPRQAQIRQGQVTVQRQDDAGVMLDVALPDGRHQTLAARHVIVTGGAGNARMLSGLGLPQTTAQLRPLHMLMIDNAPGPLWAHCFDASDKPRVTITTHRRSDGSLIWYVGGLLAENGVAQDEATLIATAKAEFAMLLPRVDFSGSRFAGLRVDRAEGATPDGRKPDGPVVHKSGRNGEGRVWLAWPTKLALAPRLADIVLADLPPPSSQTIALPAAQLLADWPLPPLAPPPWEVASWR